MKAEEKRMLAGMMRRMLALMADRRALITLLDTAVDKKVPPNWRDDLEHLRQTPEYRKILEEYEPTIRELEESSELDDLIPILEKLNEGKLPN